MTVFEASSFACSPYCFTTSVRRFGKQSAPAETKEVSQWRNWADATLVNLVTLNVYRSFSESFQVMEYVRHEQSFNAMEQTGFYALGGLIMYFVGTRLPKKYGYTDADVREELRKEINSFIAAGAVSSAL